MQQQEHQLDQRQRETGNHLRPRNEPKAKKPPKSAAKGTSS
jgi:hypothetical protein